MACFCRAVCDERLEEGPDALALLFVFTVGYFAFMATLMTPLTRVAYYKVERFSS